MIRVNTNQLNPVTHWSSIDQGADEDRIALQVALEGNPSFPDSFRAVDTASRNRTGNSLMGGSGFNEDSRYVISTS